MPSSIALSILCIKVGSLIQTQCLVELAGWLVISYLCLLHSGVTMRSQHPISIHMDSGDPNSDPHAHIRGNLSTESSPQTTHEFLKQLSAQELIKRIYVTLYPTEAFSVSLIGLTWLNFIVRTNSFWKKKAFHTYCSQQYVHWQNIKKSEAALFYQLWNKCTMEKLAHD